MCPDLSMQLSYKSPYIITFLITQQPFLILSSPLILHLLSSSTILKTSTAEEINTDHLSIVQCSGKPFTMWMPLNTIQLKHPCKNRVPGTPCWDSSPSSTMSTYASEFLRLKSYWASVGLSWTTTICGCPIMDCTTCSWGLWYYGVGDGCFEDSCWLQGGGVSI